MHSVFRDCVDRRNVFVNQFSFNPTKGHQRHAGQMRLASWCHNGLRRRVLGFSVLVMVEPRGFEPLTFSLRM